MTNKAERRHKYFRKLVNKDRILKWLYKKYPSGSCINLRLDELRRFAGIDRYSFNYFCPGFFTSDEHKSSRQHYFNTMKESIKKRIKYTNG